MNAQQSVAMPSLPQGHFAGPSQNKGTLNPGQIIQIQALTVTVERFLSQGGFAHVYLVRSATPVNGTTQHVLKRMLVSDDAMLREVKKEVDIMKLLRGHSNIVNLIDSAWNRLADGRYEVFILMEFCAGGGIIDMMNRRLRERLTEAEILQIFVDVCEGVAVMHSLRPALLHRDLKVENILQASHTSFKLCDFGSATPVTRPPTTPDEIRLLEMDLNRHTTLQYRAPEMIDPYQRRPIDEKSDVWALGVLLYKLCYYTTPFEEHGPLAILNVQYKIPPYPVYSHHMNALIASMLREHGTQRPSVFDVLRDVHRMRGTKSRYNYAQVQNHTQPEASAPPMPSKDVTQRMPNGQAAPPLTNAAQTRQMVLDAIAPLRRGRPTQEPEPQLRQQGHARFGTTNERWSAPKPSETSEQVKPPVPKPAGAWELPQGTAAGDRDRFAGFHDSFNPKADRLESKVANVSQQLPPGFIMPTPSRLLQTSRATAPLKSPDTNGSSQPISAASHMPSSGLSRPTTTNSINHGLASAFPQPSIASDSVTANVPSPRPTPEGRSKPTQELSAEERFPSIDQLEGFAQGPPGLPNRLGRRPPSPTKPLASEPIRPVQSQLVRNNYTGGLKLSHDTLSAPDPPLVARSQQVTGTAMKSNNPPVEPGNPDNRHLSKAFPVPVRPVMAQFPTAERPAPAHRRPQLSRKHRSSMAIKLEAAKSPVETNPNDLLHSSPAADSKPLITQRTPSPSAVPQRDWLTGDDAFFAPLVKAGTGHARSPTPTSFYEDPNKVKRVSLNNALLSNGRVPTKLELPGAPVQGASGWRAGSPSHHAPMHQSGHDHRSMPSGMQAYTNSRNVYPTLDDIGKSPPPLPNRPSTDAQRPPTTQRKSVSPKNLSKTRATHKNGDDSSDYEEGPEDLDSGGVVAQKKLLEREKERERAREREHEAERQLLGSRESDDTPRTRKSRPNSVHDLVDLWGGTGSLTRPEHEKLASALSRVVPAKGAPYQPDLINLTDSPVSTRNVNVANLTPTKRTAFLFPPVEALDRWNGSRTSSSGTSSSKDEQAGSAIARTTPEKSSGWARPKTTGSVRPQSLYINPAQATAATSLDTPVSPSFANPSRHHTSASRRGSISDMVSKFEALSAVSAVSAVSGYSASSESGSAKSRPTTSAKGPTLKGSSTVGLSQEEQIPETWLLRLPVGQQGTLSSEPAKLPKGVKHRTSPSLFVAPNSPQEPTVNHTIPRGHKRESSAGIIGHKNITTPIRPGMVRRASMSPNHPTPRGEQYVPTGAASDSVAAPLVPTAISQPVPRFKETPLSITSHVNATTPPLSPAPERPYRGVGKLIDQWQKKTEEAEGKVITPRVLAKPGGPRHQRKEVMGRGAGG